jgi:hypothetical protein
MDPVLRNTLGLFMILVIIFTSVVSYNGFVEKSYHDSLASTYSYTLSLSTDSLLSNSTFFLPVPADPSGNSPVVSHYSAGNTTGLPEDWTVALYDTGKATLVKITSPGIGSLQNTSPQRPFTVILSLDLETKEIISTRDPVNTSALYRPIQSLHDVGCPAAGSPVQDSPRCFRYLTSLYADYQAPPGTIVNITSTITGKNSWKIVNNEFNEYHSSVTVVMNGAQKGWTVMAGELEQGRGTTVLPTIPEKTFS